MTKPENPKLNPLPLLLVYGKPTGPDLPQASWFRIEDRTAVVAAARALKLTIIDIATEEDRALLVGVHEGVLKAGGRLIVGSVAVDVYKRIEERAAKATGAAAASPKSSLEQKTNDGDKPSTAAASVPWSELRIGSYVIGKYWYDTGEANGWWLAVIIDIDGDDLVIRWPDEPLTPPVKIQRKHIAILHPSFDPKTEWDRKR